MEIRIYQVDAFASQVFEGNPAAVCPLDKWLPDELLQKIAEENNLSETAFFVAEENTYSLRWFTPKDEVNLCGHATLAAAHVIFEHLEHNGNSVQFNTRSGILTVEQSADGYSMDFPASLPKAIKAPDLLLDALGVTSENILLAFDYLVVLANEAEVSAVAPDFNKLAQLKHRGVIITAPGNDVDFVSRCFFPKLRVNEDPVTGSAHCELAPYWAEKLGKNILTAKQLSKRIGQVNCAVIGNRVILKGNAIDYLQGKITVSGVSDSKG